MDDTDGELEVDVARAALWAGEAVAAPATATAPLPAAAAAAAAALIASSSLRFLLFLRCTPGKLPPPPPLLLGTILGSPVGSMNSTSPSLPFFFLRRESERAYRRPQALHSVLWPDGPRRHSGLLILPHPVHALLGEASGEPTAAALAGEGEAVCLDRPFAVLADGVLVFRSATGRVVAAGVMGGFAGAFVYIRLPSEEMPPFSDLTAGLWYLETAGLEVCGLTGFAP